MGNIIAKTEYNNVINEKTPLLQKHKNEPETKPNEQHNTKNKDFIYICF